MTPEKEELDRRSKQQGPVKAETEKKTDEALQIQYIVQATDTLAVKQSEIPTIHAKGVNVIEYGTEGIAQNVCVNEKHQDTNVSDQEAMLKYTNDENEDTGPFMHSSGTCVERRGGDLRRVALG